VAEVEPVGPASFHMDLHLLENRFEFPRALLVRAVTRTIEARRRGPKLGRAVPAGPKCAP